MRGKLLGSLSDWFCRMVRWSHGQLDESLCRYNANLSICPINIKKVDKQLTHAIHVKDRYVNDTFIDKLTKWYQ